MSLGWWLFAVGGVALVIAAGPAVPGWVGILGLFGAVAAAGSLGATSLVVVATIGVALLWRRPWRAWARRRLRLQLERQLPEVLALLADQIRAGRPLSVALVRTAERFPEPAASLLARLAQRAKLGMSIREALLVEVPGAPAIWTRTLHVAAVVATHGGSLAEVFGQAADWLARRRRIEERLATQTAQARLQLWVVGLLPIAILCWAAWLDPTGLRFLLTTAVGRIALVFAAVCEAVAIVWARRIMRLEET